MAINNPLIPGDPYSYDLKWLVQKVKEHGIFIDGIPATIEALINEVVKEMSLPTEYINAKYPGHGLTGVVGDGTTDDTDAFTEIVKYCRVNDKPLYVPADCTILLTDNFDIKDVHNIIMQGTITGDASLTLSVMVAATNVIPTTWNINTIDGMKLVLKGMKNGLIRVQFASDLELLAETALYYSIAYNTFILGNISHFTINGDSSVPGWVNSNVFLGGRISSEFTVKGTYGHNNNVWYGTMFEGGATVDFQIGHGNYLLNTRGEGAITYNFDVKATGNIITTEYTSNQPYVRKPIGVFTINDPNGSNTIITDGSKFTAESSLTLSKNSGTYIVQTIQKQTNGMHASYTGQDVMTTDLIPVNKPVWIGISSDAAAWRLVVELYDENGTRITTEPTNLCRYGGVMSWDTNNNIYVVGPTAGSAYGFARYLYGNDSGVAYIKARVITAAGLSFTNLTAYIAYGKDRVAANWHYAHDKIVGSNAPTIGDWTVGDIVYSTAPIAGGMIGWVCVAAGTPGTWKTFGAISS